MESKFEIELTERGRDICQFMDFTRPIYAIRDVFSNPYQLVTGTLLDGKVDEVWLVPEKEFVAKKIVPRKPIEWE